MATTVADINGRRSGVPPLSRRNPSARGHREGAGLTGAEESRATDAEKSGRTARCELSDRFLRIRSRTSSTRCLHLLMHGHSSLSFQSASRAHPSPVCVRRIAWPPCDIPGTCWTSMAPRSVFPLLKRYLLTAGRRGVRLMTAMREGTKSSLRSFKEKDFAEPLIHLANGNPVALYSEWKDKEFQDQRTLLWPASLSSTYLRNFRAKRRQSHSCTLERSLSSAPGLRSPRSSVGSGSVLLGEQG